MVRGVAKSGAPGMIMRPLLMLWVAPSPASKCHEGRRRWGDPESRACLLLALFGSATCGE